MCESPMRAEQAAAKAELQREIAAKEKSLAEHEAKREFKRRLLDANDDRPKRWPVCLRCRVPVAPNDMHWLVPDCCDSHGVNALEKLIGRVVKRHGRRITLKLLKQLGN